MQYISAIATLTLTILHGHLTCSSLITLSAACACLSFASSSAFLYSTSRVRCPFSSACCVARWISPASSLQCEMRAM